MILMGGVMGLSFLLFLISHLFPRLRSWFKIKADPINEGPVMLIKKDPSSVRIFFDYAGYYRSHPFESTASFGFLLFRLIRSACALSVLCLFLCLPVYMLKQSDAESTSERGETQYVTHTHMYNWLWTMAFVSGTTPAIILLVAGFVCLSYFNFIMNRLGGGEKTSPLLSVSKAIEFDEKAYSFRRLLAAVFLINIIVVGTVNGLYVWSTLLDLASDIRLWIQLSFALFSFLWGATLRRGLPTHIKESRYGVWLFICLNVINNVMIPCVVTALSTPSCYQVRYHIFLK
jgi:hypothetical protein